ncbi:MAG: XRE family transcriptional regulator [Oxalobacteraceae bacterium]|nr:MAG: XRE family transcriptional regulator [Oxalobacteraceae bacterium]
MENRLDGQGIVSADESDAQRARRHLQVEVGAKIKSLREDAGIGQAECASHAGIDKSSMFRAEKGELNITLETLARLALGIGVSMDRFVSGVTIDPAIVERRVRK